MMRFVLFHGERKIADVVKEEMDFPAVFGRFTYTSSFLNPTDPEGKRLLDFIRLQEADLRLSDREFDLPKREKKAMEGQREKMDAEMERYGDYIDSEDWRLVDENGQSGPIHVPFMRDDGSIVWRWRL